MSLVFPEGPRLAFRRECHWDTRAGGLNAFTGPGAGLAWIPHLNYTYIP
jgi:hypothetical protein